jgi:methyl-accepting chemotaxis protein
MKQGMQSIRAAMDDIDAALRDQAAACRSASERLRLAAQGTQTHREVAGQLEASVLTLRTQAEELRSEVRRFRI